MEFINVLAKEGVTPLAVDTLLLLLAPMTPHIAAELWELRHGTDIHAQVWPQADPAMARLETTTLVVQVNGKVRDRIEVDPDVSAEEAERLALASPRVQEALSGAGGAAPKKVIARPPRLVNVVV
jgi:leucyl-tRNA synthetase